MLLLQALRFYSRLPVPRLARETDPHGPPDFERLPAAVPLAGAVIALVPAFALLACVGIGLPALPAAAACVTAGALATGFFHEDALADTADGLFGGTTVSRRLEIMRDSRIGAFGASALGFGLILRVSLLAALLEAGGLSVAALAVVASGSLSRAAGLVPLALLPPVRPDGFGSKAALRRPRVALAVLLAGAIAACLFAARVLAAGAAAPHGLSPLVHAGLVPAMAATFGALAGSLAVTGLAKAKIGGQTGDIAGAAQQAGEIGLLAALVALVRAG